MPVVPPIRCKVIISDAMRVIKTLKILHFLQFLMQFHEGLQ